MDAPLVVVGDLLLDLDITGSVTRLCPDAPVPVLDGEQELARPGGAGLAAVLAAASAGGRPVRLLTALGADVDAERLRQLLDSIELVSAPAPGATPVKCRMVAGGRSLLRVDRGGLGAPRWRGGQPAAALTDAAAVIVSDYGRGVAADPAVRAALARAARRVAVVWDPHPHGPSPVPGARLVTPNLGEAVQFAEKFPGRFAGGGLPAAPAEVRPAARAERAARVLLPRWRCAGIAITLGGSGALLCTAGGVSSVPAPPVVGGDPCGAGDRFAVGATLALLDGAAPDESVAAGVAAASGFVAAGGAGALRRGLDGRFRSGAGWPTPAGPSPRSPAAVASAPEVQRVITAVRGRGGTVVATGGCFDVLHAGHARTLAAARALGDCLVVCLNSDESVRRLKGPGRPVMAQADRVELLAALRCVDAVVVFDEDSPAGTLSVLRPDVWVKGGDYIPDELPEAPLVGSWGGRVVAVPYHAGRSSTRLVSALGRHPAAPAADGKNGKGSR